MSMVFRDATITDLGRIVEIYNTTIHTRMVTADTEPVTTESRIAWFHEHNAITGRFGLLKMRKADHRLGKFSIFLWKARLCCNCRDQHLFRSITTWERIGQRSFAIPSRRQKHFGIKTLLGFIFAHNEPSLKLFRNAGFEDWAHPAKYCCAGWG
jgi:L-amino acid N-acyltransferase YncA